MQKRHFLFLFLSAVLIGGILLLLPASQSAKLTLTDPSSGRVILAAVIGEGQKVSYTWTNSIFRIPVREVFVLQDGSLTLREIASGNVQEDTVPVTSANVEDLYHTGDEFYSNEMNRPFRRIAFRVGEIGMPRLEVGNHLVDFKQEVGFGGQIVLEVQPVRMYEVFLYRLKKDWPAHPTFGVSPMVSQPR